MLVLNLAGILTELGQAWPRPSGGEAALRAGTGNHSLSAGKTRSRAGTSASRPESRKTSGCGVGANSDVCFYFTLQELFLAVGLLFARLRHNIKSSGDVRSQLLLIKSQLK